MTRRNCVVIVLVMLSLTPVFAHHTVARTFDVERGVLLRGVIVGIQWQQPHVIFHLRVPAEGGAAVDWDIESRHPGGMTRSGIQPETIRVGDTVTFDVFLARDGSHRAATASVTLVDGRTVRVCTVTNDACP
jgi:hypothetical protein